jgi:hypothetical protein
VSFGRSESGSAAKAAETLDKAKKASKDPTKKDFLNMG